MLLLDAGTTYSKTYCTRSGCFDIFPSRDLHKFHENVSIACGHFAANAVKKVNELVALSMGALQMVDDDDFCVVDVGSRDIKYVLIKNRAYHSCDWNQSCGAFTGFTIEMIGKYFDLDYASMKASLTEFSVTCGVFGMAGIFDKIADGISTEETVAAFIRGIASSVHRFANRPDKLYLSGGLCENRLFMDSFPCESIPLGRFVILEGLKQYSLLHEHQGVVIE